MGSLLAAQLERDPDVEYVAGLDTRRPRLRLEHTEFIEADIRDPAIGRLIPRTGVDTIVHEQIVSQPGPRMSSLAMHDINVIGTLQLLAACERVPTLRTIVVRGSAGVYGAEPQAPQFFSEEMTRLFPLRTRFQRDVAEIENYFETYSRRHAGVSCTMLRYQPAIGPACAPRSRATSRSRSAPRSWASTRAYSSCTSTTPWTPSAPPCATRSPAA